MCVCFVDSFPLASLSAQGHKFWQSCFTPNCKFLAAYARALTDNIYVVFTHGFAGVQC